MLQNNNILYSPENCIEMLVLLLRGFHIDNTKALKDELYELNKSRKDCAVCFVDLMQSRFELFENELNLLEKLKDRWLELNSKSNYIFVIDFIENIILNTDIDYFKDFIINNKDAQKRLTDFKSDFELQNSNIIINKAYNNFIKREIKNIRLKFDKETKTNKEQYVTAAFSDYFVKNADPSDYDKIIDRLNIASAVIAHDRIMALKNDVTRFSVSETKLQDEQDKSLSQDVYKECAKIRINCVLNKTEFDEGNNKLYIFTLLNHPLYSKMKIRHNSIYEVIVYKLGATNEYKTYRIEKIKELKDALSQ